MINLTGISFQMKDNRIEKRLIKEGFTDYEIFYSPIQSWVFLVSLITISSITCYGGIFALLWLYPIPTAIYVFASYLVAAFSNNSFAFTSNKLIIVNPNFPFRNIFYYDLKEISQIKIDKSRYLLALTFFSCVVNTNYIEISIQNKSKRFYCSSLDIDCYDENWTEKTLDDFYSSALGHNIKVFFNLN